MTDPGDYYIYGIASDREENTVCLSRSGVHSWFVACFIAAGPTCGLTALVDAQERRPIPDAVLCGDCRIELEPITSLETAAVVGEPLALAMAPDGRIFVTFFRQPTAISEFDSSGRFIRTIGRSGQGPGEFTRLSTLHLGKDSLFAFDASNARASIFTLQGIYVRSFPIYGRVVGATTLGRDIIVNADIPAPDKIGYPLHRIAREGTVLSSLGETQGGIYRPDLPYQSLRALTSDGSRFWSAPRTSYEITEWNEEGRDMGSLVRAVPWFEPYFQRHTFGPENLPDPWLTGLQWLGGDRLAVAIHVPASDWRDHLGPAGETADGSPFYPNARPFAIYDTILEVLDTVHGRVVTSTRISDYVAGFADPDIMYSYREDSIGQPAIDIWRIRVERP